MDSWLEALARRSQIAVRAMVAALGWQVPNHSGGLVAGIPAEVLRRIEARAGLPAGRLDDAVLDRYRPAGVVLCRGSRYCPSCLAGRDGRWLLAWCCPSLKIPMKAALATHMWGAVRPRSRGGCGALVVVVPVVVGEVPPVMCRWLR